MARTEKPITGTGPLANLAKDLRALRATTGLTYRQMRLRCGHERVGSTLSQAANGVDMPSWETVTVYVTICGDDPVKWRRRFLAAAEEQNDPGTAAPTAPVHRLRPRVHLDGPAPVPWGATTGAAFVDGMNKLYVWAGRPPLREVAHRSGVPSSTLHSMLQRTTLPRWELTKAFLKGMNVSPDHMRDWNRAWERVADAEYELRRGRGIPQPPSPSHPRRAS